MFCDFVVKHNWETESEEALVEKIFYSVFIGRIKSNKPCNVMVSGGSGEGKSISGGIKLEEVLMKLQGVDDILPYFNAMNVYIPLEFPRKMKAMLSEPSLKKANIFVIHESRELVNSKTWQSFLTQAVASINAQSRQIKRLITIFVSQSMSDIAKEVRKTFNFFIIMKRPRGKRPRMKIKVLWLDERDPEKPMLRTRNLSGLVIDQHGRYKQLSPTYFEITPPRKDLIELFDKQDREAKGVVIQRKLDKMMAIMEKEMGVSENRVEVLVNYYTKDISMLALIGKKNKNGWKITGDTKKMLNLGDDEFKIFEKRVNDAVNKVPEIDEKKLSEELDL